MSGREPPPPPVWFVTVEERFECEVGRAEAAKEGGILTITVKMPDGTRSLLTRLPVSLTMGGRYGPSQSDVEVWEAKIASWIEFFKRREAEAKKEKA